MHPKTQRRNLFDIGLMLLRQGSAPSSVDFLQWLNANRDLAEGKDARGKTLLHHTIELLQKESEWGVQIPLAVLSANPAAAKELDNERRSPLHVALSFGSPASLAIPVLQAWPGAVKQRDRHGALPLFQALHGAVNRFGSHKQAPPAVILAVLASWPDAASEQTGHCRTPLHAAMDNRAPAEVVRALLEAWSGKCFLHPHCLSYWSTPLLNFPP
jgi:hypothetical protein